MAMARGRETPAERAYRSRTLAAFFAAGAVLSTLVILLPGWDAMHRVGIAITVVLAGIGAMTLFALADHIGRVTCHGFTVSGTLLIGICQALAGGGSASATYAMLYIWVALHASLFFSFVAVTAYLTLTTVAHASVLVYLGELPSLAPQLALTVGTQTAAVLVVGSLTKQQRRLADTDSLTGLANRRMVERTLERTLTPSRRKKQGATCIALFDLNGFKAVNDLGGHAAGDRALVEVATTWRGLLRSPDTLARTGGDEFTAILPDCDLAEAMRLVQRLVEGTPAGISCSAGVARWDGHEPSQELIQRADQALYAAKVKGPVALAHPESRDFILSSP